MFFARDALIQATTQNKAGQPNRYCISHISETIIFFCFAASVSIILYPVASTPIYFNWPSRSIVSLLTGTLLVKIISASFILSTISDGVRFFHAQSDSPILFNSFHERSPGFNVYPSSTTIFIFIMILNIISFWGITVWYLFCDYLLNI